jgi:hypothetical protein
LEASATILHKLTHAAVEFHKTESKNGLDESKIVKVKKQKPCAKGLLSSAEVIG